MWIALGIVGGLACLIAVALTLPIYVSMKDDVQGEPVIRYHFLGKTFGDDPNPDHPLVTYLMDVSGLSRTKTSTIKSNMKTSGVSDTVKDTCMILWSLLEQVVALLPHCKLTRLRFTMVCTADDADEAAIHYARCCSVVYPILAWIHGCMKVNPKREYIDVRSDFNALEDELHYDVKLRTNVCRVLVAFVKIVYEEAVRANQHLISAQTQATRRKKNPRPVKRARGKR